MGEPVKAAPKLKSVSAYDDICIVPGCGREYFPSGHGCGRGMCMSHYRRWLRSSPTPLNKPIRRYVRSA